MVGQARKPFADNPAPSVWTAIWMLIALGAGLGTATSIHIASGAIKRDP